MPAMMRALRGGESVALLCDLYHRHHPFLLPFFGRPVTTVRAPGILAARIERPIVPAFCVRTGPFRYRILVRPPLFPRTDLSREAAARDLMERVNGEIEDFVRAHPESWQWNYRRWKLPPEDPDEPDELDDAKDA
jgi:KDO2-lipid IV(A) lauroyltransferase